MLMNINKVVCFYNEFYEKKIRERKQSLITRFLSAPGALAPEPTPITSNDDDNSDSVEMQCHLFNDDNDGNVSDFEGFYDEVTALDEIAPSTDGVESQIPLSLSLVNSSPRFKVSICVSLHYICLLFNNNFFFI